MKTPKEIEEVHDLISRCLSRAMKIQMMEEYKSIPESVERAIAASLYDAEVSLDVLCWVLDHNHETSFEDHMAYLRGWEKRLNKATKEDQGEQPKHAKEPQPQHTTYRHKHRRHA